jgi:hypothetical protein
MGLLHELGEKQMIIGIVGRKRHGKDTFADMLVAQGFSKISYATKLKEIVGDLYNLSHDQLYGDEKETVDPRWGMSARQILERFGDGIRDNVHPDTWVKYALRDLDPTGLYVVSDVRHFNEAAAISNRGGILIRVQREGVEHTTWEDHVDHIAVHYTIENDADLEAYQHKCQCMIDYLLTRS